MISKLRVGLAAAIAVAFVSTAGAETLLQRGTYLMNSIVACGNCHTPMGPKGPIMDKVLAGGLKFDEKPFTAYASNITPDPETGIGKWTDAQLILAIREGKRPDGSIIGPPMPIELYRDLSDTDVKAIVAYLRTVEPVKNVVPKSVYRMPLPKDYGPPVGAVADVPRTDKVKYGHYLANAAGHCTECHTPLEANGQRDFKNKVGLGGDPFRGPWGVTVARNITQHPDAGLGKWTDAEIKRAITQGISRDGSKLKPPMGFAYYKNISAADQDALVAYLRTLKPLVAK
ncbi:MAG: c-type cytochrome [Alphaproteobacteria bacterium]